MRKKILLSLSIIVGVMIVAGILFFNLNPEFEKGLSKEQKKQFEKLSHFQNGKFINKEKVEMTMRFRK